MLKLLFVAEMPGFKQLDFTRMQHSVSRILVFARPKILITKIYTALINNNNNLIQADTYYKIRMSAKFTIDINNITYKIEL